MTPKLSKTQKNALETQHRVERDGRVRDRTKAMLLKSEGWTNKTIIKTYLKLLEDTPAHDPILFIDAVHPTMAQNQLWLDHLCP